ncbi:PLP-dependent aminotransferase family protein [Proteobacteria bacterium 005FR1]|nr:PLP-dependent aminotransferase family protein [Proteobacteria bacterium 005FR1]
MASDHLYSRIAEEIAERIDSGLYQPGEKLPGIRVLSDKQGVSPATAVAAYRKLEADGFIEARPRSGFFVRARRSISFAEPRQTDPRTSPRPVNGQQRALQLIEASRQPHIIPLGAAVPDPSYLPSRAVERALASAARQHRVRCSGYEFGSVPELQRQVARLMAESGSRIDPNDVVITNGCQEALLLSLKLMTKAGDVVALESPTYYGLLQAVDTLGLKALEIPTDPRQGMSMEALQLALEQWPVKVCVVMPNFANPLGSCMSDERKRALLALASRYDLALIEDDIYGSLRFSGQRPSCLKTFDTEDRVFHCSSLSKTLSPGLRVGWVVSHRHREALAYQKFLLNSASPSVTQLAAAQILESGKHERHLRVLRGELGRSVARMQAMLDRHFPAGIRVTRPEGGFVLWLELPVSVDSTELAQAALQEGISIAPGALFSTTDKYHHHIRLSCAVRWSDRVERALIRLGQLIKERC